MLTRTAAFALFTDGFFAAVGFVCDQYQIRHAFWRPLGPRPGKVQAYTKCPQIVAFEGYYQYIISECSSLYRIHGIYPACHSIHLYTANRGVLQLRSPPIPVHILNESLIPMGQEECPALPEILGPQLYYIAKHGGADAR